MTYVLIHLRHILGRHRAAPVLIYGTRGREETEMAAVNRIAEVGEAYAAPQRAEARGFTAEIAKHTRPHHGTKPLSRKQIDPR